jgi:glyoxylase-like metal-dependent hydrolase (beta-lactamase superfamily II)
VRPHYLTGKLQIRGEDLVSKSKLIVEVVVSQLFAENTYVARLEGRADCVVFDPGFDADLIIGHIQQRQLTLGAILNTHGHADHIAGNAALKKRYPDCPLVIGSREASKLTNPMENLSGTYGIALTSPPADRLVQGGDTVEAAGMVFEVRETPGHSCGHVVYLWKGEKPWFLFGGDMLFQGSVGRADFPDSDPHQLIHSIRNQLYTLPDDTIVMSGHGDPTTIGEEKRYNPFVRGGASPNQDHV